MVEPFKNLHFISTTDLLPITKFTLFGQILQKIKIEIKSDGGFNLFLYFYISPCDSLQSKFNINLSHLFRFWDLWIPEATGSHDSEKGDQTERWGNKKISGDFLYFSFLAGLLCLLIAVLLFTESAFLLSWHFLFLLNTPAVFMNGLKLSVY